MERPMIDTTNPTLRRLRFGVAALAMGAGLPAMAQDFNAAPPNAPEQQPAFEGQTRAPVIAEDITLKQEVLVEGLDRAWGMAPLPDGTWLITERPGNLRIYNPADGSLSDPVAGLPEVSFTRQGGLLDVAVRDDFAETRRVWLSFAEPRGEGTDSTSVATGRLSDDGTTLEDMRVIFQQNPAWESELHYGSRLVFDNEGMLFVTTGERSNPEPRMLAQDVTTHLGKVLRLNPDGGAAEGNPGIEGGQPEIWSYGHRNMQGATLGPDGALWTVEHGARGGDEINRPDPGVNYGWPLATYGIEYGGDPIGDGETMQDGMQQPLYYWDPVIAPSGLTFYEGEMFPDWNGSLLIGGLAGQALVRVTLDGTSVTGEQRYLQGEYRIRDVDIAPDGAVLVLTDGEDGKLIRLTPEE